MKFNLSNIKTANSRNGFSMSAILLIDDIKVCQMRDAGDGGEPSFDVLNKELFNKWENELSQLPEIYVPSYDMDIKIDKGLFIDLLHAAIVNRTEFKLLAA